MKNSTILCVATALVLISCCAYKELTPGEVQAYVDNLCRSAANHIPTAEQITYGDPNPISYSDCMIDHGYLEKL
jgi:hypothetical protein